MRILCHINRELSRKEARYRERMEQSLTLTSIFNIDTIDAIMDEKNFSYVLTYADSTVLYVPSVNAPKHWHAIEISFQRDWTKRYLFCSGYCVFITIPGPGRSTYTCFVKTRKQLERALEKWESVYLKKWESVYLKKWESVHLKKWERLHHSKAT
jgi:hypothetical protein